MCVCEPQDIDGYKYWSIAANVFQDCVYTPKDYASWGVGILSMLIWMIALWPQFFQNCRTGSVASQSIYMWMLQLFGDLTNLTGCLLSSQLPTMTGLACLYCSISISMFSQHIYYTRCVAYKPEEEEEEEDPLILKSSSHSIPSSWSFASPRQPYITPSRRKRIAKIKWSPDKDTSYNRNRNHRSSSLDANVISTLHTRRSSDGYPSVITRSILFPIIFIVSLYMSESISYNEGKVLNNDFNNSTITNICGATDNNVNDIYYKIGVVIGWVMMSSYLLSRSPQIYLNWVRGDIEGLSYRMFALTVCGNLTYLLSILLRAIPPSHVESDYLYNKLPWLIDAGGCMIQDIIILGQCMYYTRKKKFTKEEEGKQPLLYT